MREVLIADGGVDAVRGYEEGGRGGCGVGEGYFDRGFCFLGGVRYLWQNGERERTYGDGPALLLCVQCRCFSLLDSIEQNLEQLRP